MEGKLNNGAFPVRRVADICEKIVDGPFGSNLKVEEYQETGIPLIRVSNVRSGVVEGDFVFISEEKQVELKRSRVLPNDVLLTKAGAILGYSAVLSRISSRGKYHVSFSHYQMQGTHYPGVFSDILPKSIGATPNLSLGK